MSDSVTDGALIQMVYASAATVHFDDDDLNQLLDRARSFNATLDITGVLLYTDGTFFQVLEGEPEAVQSLYEKIELDERHNNVLLLASQPIISRNFGDWRMGFVRSREEIEELPGFVDFFSGSNGARTFVDLYGDSQRMSHILEGFRRGRWRRTVADVT